MNRADELAAIAAALHTPRHQILPEMAAGELTPYTLAEMSGRKRADIRTDNPSHAPPPNTTDTAHRHQGQASRAND